MTGPIRFDDIDQELQKYGGGVPRGRRPLAFEDIDAEIARYEASEARKAEVNPVGELARGAARTAISETPRSIGGTLEAIGSAAGEQPIFNLIPSDNFRGKVSRFFAPDAIPRGLEEMGRRLRAFGESKKDVVPPPAVPSLSEVRSPRDFALLAGNAIGSGVASSVPAIVTGAGAAKLGASAAGVAMGAFGGSYLQNTGDVIEELEQTAGRSLSKEEIRDRGLALGVPISLLDAAIETKALQRLAFGGNLWTGAKDAAVRVGKSALGEGVTEMAQEGMQYAGTRLGTDTPMDAREVAFRVADAGVQGLLAGGAFGVGGEATSAIARDLRKREFARNTMKAQEAAAAGVPVEPAAPVAPVAPVAPPEAIVPEEAPPPVIEPPVLPPEVAPPVSVEPPAVSEELPPLSVEPTVAPPPVENGPTPPVVQPEAPIEVAPPSDNAGDEDMLRGANAWIPREGPPGISTYSREADGTNEAPQRVFVSRDETGAVSGYLALWQNPEDPRDGWDVEDVRVREQDRRKGIATSLYRAASEAGLNVRSGAGLGLTPEGDALTRTLAARGITQRDDITPSDNADVSPPAYAPLVFSSGANRVPDMRGLAAANHPIGVAADKLSSNAIAELEGLGGKNVPVFLDSGAFSEVEYNPETGRLEDVAPIGPEEWDRRIGIAERLAPALGAQLHVVAPDRIGDQARTLERITTYADRLRGLSEKGAQVLVALQTGPDAELDAAGFYRKVSEILGFEPIAALPMNKAAMSTDEVRAFVQQVRPAGVHLLGMGEYNRRADEVLAAIREVAPDLPVSMDSNRIAAKVGTKNGPGKGPREITRAQQELTERSSETAYDETTTPQGERAADYTDDITRPSGWATMAELKRIAKEAGLNKGQTKVFLADPDEFLQAEDDGPAWYENPLMSEALDAAWLRYQQRTIAPANREEAVRGAFTQDEEVAPSAESVSSETTNEVPATQGRAPIAGVAGRETTVIMPDNSRLSGVYMLIEAEDLQPSHDAFSFQPNPRYAPKEQGRDYARNKAVQDAIEARTMEYDPQRGTNPSESIGEGPPTVLPDGSAVAGNERSMLLKRIIQFAPQRYAAYRAMLEARAAIFGYDAAAVAGMKKPILVRMLTDPKDTQAGPARWQEINRLSDETTTKRKSADEDSASRAQKMVNATEALDHLATTMDPESTVFAYLGTPAGKEFTRMLIKANVITKEEFGELTNDQQELTEAGRKAVQRMLLSAAVGDGVAILDAPASILEKLEHAVPAILSVRYSDFDISRLLAHALRMSAEAVNTPGGIEALGSQRPMFGEAWPQEVTNLAIQLRDMPKAGTTKKDGTKTYGVKDAFRRYGAFAREAMEMVEAGDMFGGTPYGTPEKAAAEAFKTTMPESSPLLGKPGEKPDTNGSPGTVLGSPMVSTAAQITAIAQGLGVDPKAATKTVIAKERIVRSMAKMLQVPVNKGRAYLTQRMAAGVYFVRQRDIRLRRLGNVGTFAHETGHAISDAYRVAALINARPLSSERAAIRRELVAMGKALYGNRRPAGGYMEEGIAQYARFYVTEPGRERTEAPTFAAIFDEILTSDPDLKSILDYGKEQWDIYLKAGPDARVAAMFAKPSWAMRKLTIPQLMRGWVDDLDALRVAMRTLGATFRPSQDPAILMDMARSAGIATYAMQFGVADFNTRQPVTKSFKAILEMVGEEKLDEWQHFLAMRHAKDLAKRGIDVGFEPADIDFHISRGMQNPTFVQAAAELYKFQNAVLDYMVASEKLTPELAALLKKDYPHYVPMVVADLDEAPRKGGTGRQRAASASGIKRIKGSDGAKIPVLQQIMAQTQQRLMSANAHHAAVQLVRSALRTEGGAKVATILPEVPKERQMANLAIVLKELEDQGVDTSTLDEDALNAALVAYWPKRMHGPAEMKDMVFPILLDGVPTWVQINDRDVWESFLSLDHQQLPAVLRWSGKVVSLFRTGTTGGNPNFSLVFNPIKDAFGAFPVSEGGAKFPGHQYLLGIMEYLKVATGRQSDVLEMWLREGGPSYGRASGDLRLLDQNLNAIVDEIARSKKSKIARAIMHPLRTLQMIADAQENATKIGETKLVYRKLKKQGMQGRDLEVAAVKAGREIMNFQRGGTYSRQASLFWAFFNASVQGTRKFVVSHDPKLLKTPEGREKLIGTVVKAGLAMTMPALLSWALQHDDDSWEDIPEWMHRTGLVFLHDEGDAPKGSFGFSDTAGRKRRATIIPMAPLWWQMYGYLPLKFAEFLKRKEPKQMAEAAKAIAEAVNPVTSWGTAVSPIIETWANKSYFTGQPLFPKYLEEDAVPVAQVAPKTGETARQIGEALEGATFLPDAIRSPARLENLVYGYTGGLGKMVGSGLDWATRQGRKLAGEPPLRPERRAQSWIDNTPVLQRFDRELTVDNTQTMRDFYDTYSDASAHYNRWRDLQRTRPEDAKAYFDEHRADILAVRPAPKGGGEPGFMKQLRSSMDELNATRREMQRSPLGQSDPDEYNRRLELIDQKKLSIARRLREIQRERAKTLAR